MTRKERMERLKEMVERGEITMEAPIVYYYAGGRYDDVEHLADALHQDGVLTRTC